MRQALTRLSIAAKLKLAFLLLLLMLIGMAIFAYGRMSRINTQVEQLGRINVPAMESVSGIRIGMAQYRMGVTLSLLADDGSGGKAAQQARAEGLAEAEKFLKILVDFASNDDERATSRQLMASWKAYRELAEKAVALATEGKSVEALVLAADSARPYGQMSDILKFISDSVSQESAASVLDGEQAYQSARRALIAVSLAALLCTLGLARLLIGGIAAPLQRAVAAANHIAAGALDQEIVVHGRDEIAQLLSAMQRMQHSLVEIVAGVRREAENVATASVEIASGNADLSTRTEAQAAALEETAATMNELSATVQKNAEDAHLASSTAQQASAVALQGGQVVQQVVETMRGIESSSQRISDIVGTIDGIAFQTNILALNAAVEAARAGEQGRGFAVVATEVRSLAQRSSIAARETKTLITESVERIQTGARLVDRAGQTMQEMVAAVRSVSAIVAQISQASLAQSGDISEVEGAIRQLDDALQQNAALVEQSAAASESLRQQAGNLLGTVSVFRIAAMPVAQTIPTMQAQSATGVPLLAG
ncbi:methyl-accepting chemotaxis protein [uncultured Herbaspirillum sp.]|uniref:methyl-accepting chemotaxis protein n=1 Tax=uncultured Herbaspirillum sp. TaxID=160236 RepID=UPI00258BD834|nr:methyl-accepting chemotaxis protein [uncultured Herbaspirillum sp.]